MGKISFSPIGYVSNKADTGIGHDEFRRLRSEIFIDPKYAEGLTDIEQNELITVIFYFDRSAGYQLKIHPRGDESRPITGVFNTRSQFRPNPIGLTVVKLIERKDNTLAVEGLDALDGTPVLDIKPFVRTFDEGVNLSDPGQDRALRAH